MNLASRLIARITVGTVAGTVAGLLLAGCGGTARPAVRPGTTPPAEPPAAVTPGVDFAHLDPCALATLNDVSAVLGQRAHVNNADTEDPKQRMCLYLSHPSDQPGPAVKIKVLTWPGDGARTYFETEARNWTDTTRFSGLGDAAMTFTNPGQYAYVSVLKGPFDVEVGYLIDDLAEGTPAPDLGAYLPKLRALATTVMTHF
jgi:hypothetical protein